mmetsp:Transcript_65478/g.142813  ORF Transcript_65478/g.142813 Transcript_65478/m.142813 type:complete len:631 (+) Transcript_65478:53-1945(+)
MGAQACRQICKRSTEGGDALDRPVHRDFGASELGETDPTACTLRIVQITDVYMLDNFPSLRTLIQEKRAELAERNGGKTISMLTGDFLAPYLLSSLDKGVGMMNMLNGTPIDYLTWGNHEDDIPHLDVIKREREYTGTWINTNMTTHESFKDSKCQVEYAIIEVKSYDGSNRRKIGMIGVLSASPSLYKPNAFGGAKIEDPWETMAKFKAKLEQEHGCDVVVPLCHLYEPQDERTCREFDFPVILSGHDHHVVDRVVEGTRLLKAGSDAVKAVVLDLSWASAESARKPEVDAEILNVADWPADPVLQKTAEQAYSILEPLKKTQLARVPDKYRPLTSVGARGNRVSMGTYMLSRIRDALNMEAPIEGPFNCDCALLKGGNVRGGRDYGEDENITLEVLQSELEETKEIIIIPVPGSVLRVGLKETFGAPNPGWMQYDDGVELDADDYVVSIGGKPLDLEKKYRVASISDFYRKRDAPSIGAYFEEHPDELPEPDSGVPMHALLMRLFALSMWNRIWKALDKHGKGEIDMEVFSSLDEDGDGKLSRADLKKAITRIAGFEVFDGEEPEELEGSADIVINQMINEVTSFKRETSAEGRVDAKSLQEAYRHWSSSSLSQMGDDDDESDDKLED